MSILAWCWLRGYPVNTSPLPWNYASVAVVDMYAGRVKDGYAATQSLPSHVATLLKISFGVEGYSAVKEGVTAEYPAILSYSSKKAGYMDTQLPPTNALRTRNTYMLITRITRASLRVFCRQCD